MATLTAAHIRALLNPQTAPCISLYMPTHKGAPDRREDPIRYRNLVRRAEEQLRAKYPGNQVQNLLRKFHDLADDTPFWAGTRDGLAVFAAADLFEAHRLPRTVKELVMVADSFHLKPLLRITQSADRFQVLCLTRTEASIFEGDRYGLHPAGPLPTFTEAVGEEITEPERSSIDRGARNKSTGHYSGFGARKDELDADAEKWFRAIRNAVLENYSNPTGLPLVLVALPDNASEFIQRAQNRFLLPDYVPSDPGALTLDQLRAEAWKIVEPRYLDRLARLNNDYGTAASRQKGSNLLADVVRAGRDGRIGTLLVDADKMLPGKYDLATGELKFESADNPDADDLIDDMAELALKTGADVVVVPHDRMPTDTGLAAIYRF